ncbi:MAG TPA: indolepyruvate ferredoxin oxidoreductase family protein [Deltaproteobacteria bacterium]|nr:indolepyruvate ferredoxin oxidoreductase family protein [Deltaproteobacteria bacterium]
MESGEELPVLAAAPDFDANYELEDRYRVESGRVFLTGNQALVRLPLMQRRRDVAAGLDTAGFISGYRGSPLGTFDMNLWQAKALLEQHRVRFQPGLNEDLAATAVWGTQQAVLLDGPKVDGVFAMWYGKGPGVDRACDALKHANHAGTSKHGGVLALMGDDPGAKSSSIAHQSEPAMIHCGIPILNPSNIQDYLDFGLIGWALSRYSGSWVGFKCLTDTVESSGSVLVSPDRVQIVIPDDFEMPPGGLHIGWSNLPLQVEARLFEQRLVAVRAFVRANRVDRVVLESPRRRLGIVTTGKAHGDVRQALVDMGLDDVAARDLGISIYKVGMPWPLEPEGLRRFARGRTDLLIVEEKAPIMEEQISNLLFNLSERPRLFGKHDPSGRPLVPRVGELTPPIMQGVLRRWIEEYASGAGPDSSEAREWRERLRPEAVPARPVVQTGSLSRLPSFCSGCPHNRSTVVPEGSVALGGIGCHGMAVWLPDRRTLAVCQMGGEGANWIGQSPYTEVEHIFQNMGDGTYFHSGLLAIRAAVAANVNITYKILVNGAVAMTGGQPIEGEEMAGEITTPEIARQLAAEGVERIAVLSDHIGKYTPDAFPKGVTIHDRKEIDRVQKELRTIPGVTALLYDQTCAAEARRLRKRGEFPDPDRRVVINELVCEGCGDCSVQSNCISIEPVETEFGRKRTINQSSCNKDYSCLEGYCPSFATVIGGSLRKVGNEDLEPVDASLFEGLPDPRVAPVDEPFNIFVAGIGGTGVITIGALLGMAAHLEGKGVTLLDVTGLAQKNGPVASHVRIARDPEDLHSTRIPMGGADLALACDIVVATGQEGIGKLSPETRAVVNTHVAPTADFAVSPDLDMSSVGMEAAIRTAVGPEHADFIDASGLARALLGDAIGANLFLVGFALQKGLIPVGLPALERAIELNGRAVEMNKRALAWGRLAACDPEKVASLAASRVRVSQAVAPAETLEDVVARRVAYLTDYQDARYAERYRRLVDRVAAAEDALGVEGNRLAVAVARYYFKLLAVKDEYEVMRLWASEDFQRQLDAEFEGDYKLEFHLGPQIPFLRDKETGRVPKIRIDRRLMTVLKWIRHLKFLRHTPFDLVNRSRHRRREWALVREYEEVIEEILQGLSVGNLDLAVQIAGIPEQIRGFDTVKDVQIEAAKEKEAELLDAFRRQSSGG